MSSQNARYISRKERSLVSPVSVTETVALKLIFLIGWRCGGEICLGLACWADGRASLLLPRGRANLSTFKFLDIPGGWRAPWL